MQHGTFDAVMDNNESDLARTAKIKEALPRLVGAADQVLDGYKTWIVRDSDMEELRESVRLMRLALNEEKK